MMVTIANLDTVCDNLVMMYNVYGVECLLNSLARACLQDKYLRSPDYLHKMLSNAIIRALKEEDDGKEGRI